MESDKNLSVSEIAFRRLAWIVLGITLFINVIAFWMMLPNFGTVDILGWGFLGFTVIASLMFAIVGTMILNRHPHHIVGWLYSIIGWLSSVQGLLQGYLSRFFIQGMGSYEIGEFVAWILQWIWFPIVSLIIITPLFYPNGRIPSPRWRYFVVFFIIVLIMGTSIQAFSPGKMRSSLPILDNPYGIIGLEDLFSLAFNVFFSSWIIIFIGGPVSLLGRFRNSKGIERQQIKWFFFASILVALTMPIGISNNLLGQFVFIMAMLFLPVSVGIAILQYRLWDIDLVIRRTLLYAAITITLGLIYFSSVVLLQRILTQLTGQGSPIAIVISTLAIAALFTPLRLKLQSFIDRRFYRSKYDAEHTLSDFADVARDEVEIENLVSAITSAVTDTLQPKSLNIWIIDKDTIHD